MFDKTTRVLIGMMFLRGTVDEVAGTLEDGRRWSVNALRPNMFRDGTSYNGYISGVYNEDFSGDTLEETLNKMNTWLAVEADVKALIENM